MADIRNRDFNSAQDALTQAEHINPKQPTLWYTYAALYGATLQNDKALAAARKEVDLHPGQPDMYRWLAQLQTYYKRTDEAISTLQELVKISPSDPAGVGQLTSLLIAARRYDEALSTAQNALKVLPDDVDFRIDRIDALVRSGRKDEGAQAAKDMPVASMNADQLNSVAWPLAETETALSLAVDYAQRSVAIDEAMLSEVRLNALDDEQLHRTGLLGAEWDTLGWALFLSGNSDKAEKYLIAAWKLGQQGVIADHLGQLLR